MEKKMDGVSVVVGFLVGALLVWGLMLNFGVNKWHSRWCEGRLEQALTGSDSLVVVQQDMYCIYEINELEREV